MSSSLDEAKAEAAAAVANAFLEDFAADGVIQIENAPAPVDEAPVVVSQPTPTQAPAPQITEIEGDTATVTVPTAEPEPDFDFSSFAPQLTPDLEELLDDTPDFDEEARAELQAERQAAEDRGEYVEYSGDEDAAAKLKAAEKRIAFLEDRVVQTNRGKWVQENLRAYPLLAQYGKDEVEAIDATSRRAFAKEAAKLNERVTRIAKPLLDDLASKLQSQKDSTRAEERQRVADAWGTPAGDLAGGPGAATAAQERVAAAMKTEDLGEVIKAQVETGQVRVF